MLSAYERGQLVKQAFLSVVGRGLWNAAKFSVGAGPWPKAILRMTPGLTKSPMAYEAAKNALTFGMFGGTANALLGGLTGDQAPWYERFYKGFIPGAIGGAGWGLAQTGLAKGLSKLYTQGQPITGFKQRLGAWGERVMRQTRAEMQAMQQRNLAAQAIEEARQQLRLRQQFGPTYLGSAFERGKLGLGERAARFATGFGLGAASLAAGFGGSYLAEKLGPKFEEPPALILGSVGGAYGMTGMPTPQIGRPGFYY